MKPTIDSLKGALAGDDELLVVFNGTREASRDMGWNLKNGVFHIETEVGLLAGRHYGLAKALNEVVVFLDDDVLVERTWRDALALVFDDPLVHMAGGPSRPSVTLDNDQLFETSKVLHERGWWCSALSLLDFGNERFYVDPHFVWGLNFAVRKSSLLEVGGFHPDGVPWGLRRFRGDGETAVSTAFAARGWKAVYEPGAGVIHRVPPDRLTLEYFERRAYLQGISDSYTRIRRFGAPDVVLQKMASAGRPMWRRAASRIKRAFVNAGTVSNHCAQNEPRPPHLVRTDEAYRDGFAYHQNEVANDPALLAWVLRENYFDYRYSESKKR